jgi:endo-beta-N-acetylglucosaminidase D
VERANAYAAWTPGQPFYKGFGEDMEENENFNISRIKPRERFVNPQTQVRPTQDPDRKLLWWCPIGGDGWNALSSYFFGGEVWTMWSYTDIWGNWTAPLLSMPAPMLDVCHKNGVKISSLAPIAWAATIYTSSSDGYGYLLNKLLTDAGGSDKFLKFLKYYGIDGIGFNSEFSWSGTLAGGPYSGNAFHTGMKKFLGDCYTKADSYGVPFHNCWYSLTANEGYLGGGAALSAANKDWFDYEGKPTSSVYFMNYGGSLSTSQNTVANYFPNRSSYDVFMGVDYQAGGGANWTGLLDYKISAGLWGAHNRNLIYETRGERGSDPKQQQKTYQMILENVFTGSTKNPVNPCAVTNTTRFNSMSTNAYGWAQFVTARSTLMDQDGSNLATDPFVTNFNLGNGMFFNVNGERQSNVEWYNIGMQDYMPTWRWWTTTTYMGREENQVSSDLSAEFTWDDAWFGGSCLQISGATDKTYMQLFKTKYATEKSGDYLTIRYKVLSGTGDLAWACSKEGTETTVVEKAISSSKVDENGWATVNTAIGGRSGIKLESSTIAQIGLKFTNTSDDFKILIGQIALTRGKPGTYTQPQTPVIEKVKMMARNYKGVDMKIIFNMNGAYNGAAKEAWVPVYNNDVATSYFRIYTQQENKEPIVFTATTSWAAYTVGAPYVTEDGGKMRIGVAAVGLDYETESPIAWGEWFNPLSIEPVIVEGTEIDKPIIKAGEEFTLKYIDVNHAAATWEVVNSQTGATVETFANVKGITMSLTEEGSYDIKITNPDGTVAYTRGIIQVSPAATGAIPVLESVSADKTSAEVDENITLSYTASRLGEGTVSRSVKVEDPNLLRFPEVVGSRPYTYMMWFKVDKFTHGSEGTNLIDKRSFSDVWPHNNWGDIWVTIRSYPQDAGGYPRYETSASGTTETTPHPANEISFNTYGWTEHDAPNSNMMSNDHSVNEGQWTHVAVTFGTDNKQKMYFNGKKVAETTIQHITSNGVRKPGCSVYVGGTSVYKGGFNGWVDEFQVWDRVLTDNEVVEAMKGYATAPDGLQGYWTFEDTTLDSDGNMVFPNKGKKGATYTAAVISTTGQKGENTSEVVETVVNSGNEELGNPMIGGSYQVTTSAEWSVPGASVTTSGNEAVVSYDAAGTYTAGLTLKNMWGSDSKTIEYVVVANPDGIEESVVEMMGVYPNPFTDFVNLYFAEEGNYTVDIIALDGKVIESKSIMVAASEGVRVDINGEKGMYIIKVKNANNTAVKTLKVIKK